MVVYKTLQSYFEIVTVKARVIEVFAIMGSHFLVLVIAMPKTRQIVMGLLLKPLQTEVVLGLALAATPHLEYGTLKIT